MALLFIILFFLQSSALPALSHSLRSPGTSLYEDQDGDTESSVSLERYMVKETGVEHENENINEGQQGNYERKRNHSIDSITTLGSYRELNLTQGKISPIFIIVMQ